MKHKSSGGGGPVAGSKTKQVPQKRRNNQNAKHLKFYSSSCAKAAEPTFSKMDPSKPEHARRIQQRRRMISYGKNTLGYDEYLRQVPKAKRQSRSMDTPSTPDHTLDIPNKRWLGLVKAWRRALHKYDPPDLQESFTEAMEVEEQAAGTSSSSSTPQSTQKEFASVKDRELANAKSMGLPVQFEETESSPTSVLVGIQSNNNNNSEMNELDQWDDARNASAADCFYSDNEDVSDESDDELL